MKRNTTYNIALCKGCGMVDETLALLPLCDENTTKESLAEYVHANNVLGRCTDRRSMDIVKLVFYPRFMKHNPKVVLWMKTIRDKGLMLHQFRQLLLLYCARENAIVYDYITKFLNEYRNENLYVIPSDSIAGFVNTLNDEGLVKWSDSIRKKTAGYIKSVLVDFDMLDRKGKILPYEPSDFTVLYLMHELHFEGLSDMAIWNHTDWQIFGMDRFQIQERIMDLNIKGGYISQCSGELMTISWNYKTMEDFINGKL